MSKCFQSEQCTLAGMRSSSQSDEWRMLWISTMTFKSQSETWSHSYSLVEDLQQDFSCNLISSAHTPPCEGRSRCTFLSTPPFRTGLPSITLTAICSRIFHMALRWKTLRNRVVLSIGGKRKVLPDPNSDPDKNSFLPLSCSPSIGLQPGKRLGVGLALFLQPVSKFSTSSLSPSNSCSEVFHTVPWLSEGLMFQKHLVCIVHVTCFIHICCSRQALATEVCLPITK